MAADRYPLVPDAPLSKPGPPAAPNVERPEPSMLAVEERLNRPASIVTLPEMDSVLPPDTLKVDASTRPPLEMDSVPLDTSTASAFTSDVPTKLHDADAAPSSVRPDTRRLLSRYSPSLAFAAEVRPVDEKVAEPPSPTVTWSTPVIVPDSESDTPTTTSRDGATSSPPLATDRSMFDSSIAPARAYSRSHATRYCAEEAPPTSSPWLSSW